MNENNNRVPTALPESLFEQITAGINNTESLLDAYMVGVTPDERMALPKINVDNRDFVSDAISEMKKPDAANILPAYLSPTDAIQDLRMFEQLETIIGRLASLSAKLDATRILAGSEAYSTALMFKKMADGAAAMGVKGADAISARLSERFKSRSSDGSTAPATGV